MEDIEVGDFDQLEKLLQEEEQLPNVDKQDKTVQIESYKQRVFDLAFGYVQSQPASPLIPFITHELSKAYEIALFDENNDLAVKIKRLVQLGAKSKCPYHEATLKEYCAEFLTFLLKKNTKESECYKTALFFYMQLILSNGVLENTDFVVAIWKKIFTEFFTKRMSSIHITAIEEFLLPHGDISWSLVKSLCKYCLPKSLNGSRREAQRLIALRLLNSIVKKGNNTRFLAHYRAFLKLLLKAVKNYGSFEKKNSSLVQIVLLFTKIHEKVKGEVEAECTTLLKKIISHIEKMVAKEKGLSQLKGILKKLG